MPEATQALTVDVGKKSGYRWVIVALIFLITIINYLDRSSLSYAIEPLSKEFGLNDAEFGFIASAFGIGYIVMTFFGGILVDRFGPRHIWSGAAFLWSIVTVLLAAASGFWMLFAFRTMLGVAEGPHFPALSRAITDWLPASERARAMAFGLVGVPLASVIGAPFISHLIITYGWQWMFIILGSLGLIWTVLWHHFFRDYPQSSPYVSKAELEHIHAGQEFDASTSESEIRKHSLAQGTTTWKYLLTNSALMSNNIAFFAFGYLMFFALTWLPGFLEQTYGMHLKDVGIFLIAPWACAAILIAFAGWLSDWLWKKTGSFRKSRSHLIWICQLLSAISFLPAIFIHSLPCAITSISLGVGFGLMPNAAFYALNADLAKDRTGTAIGIMDCFFAAAGILSPAITGLVAHATGGFGAAIGLLVFFTLVSVVGVIVFQHPDKK
jgi:sugar phosphate permease